MLAFLLALSGAPVPASLPDGVLFNDAPATIEQMREIEGSWSTSTDLEVFTLATMTTGWMSFKVEKGIADWPNRKQFPAAVTTHDGQLFINIPIRSVTPEVASRSDYQGKECYGVVAVGKVGDMTTLAGLDEDIMRAANRWYPKELPAWEGEQPSCGNLLVRAEAAAG